jgi:plasmid stability protein
MPAIHVRDIDDAVLEALKARAARNHRSLQGEIRAILEETVRATRAASRKRSKGLHLKTVRVGAPVRYSREVIYDDDEGR